MGVILIFFIHAAITYTFARLAKSERHAIIFTWVNAAAACLLGNVIYIGVDLAAVFGGGVLGRVHREEAEARRPLSAAPVVPPSEAALPVAASDLPRVAASALSSSAKPTWGGFMVAVLIFSLLAWGVAGIYFLDGKQSSVAHAAGRSFSR